MQAANSYEGSLILLGRPVSSLVLISVPRKRNNKTHAADAAAFPL